MNLIRPLILLLILTVTACTPLYRNHGYVPPTENLNLIQIGQTTRDEVETLIGKPSTQGVLQGSGWFYVGSRWQYYGARQPREISREVVALTFAPNGTVANVERFGLKDGHVVALSRRVTDSGVTEISLIGQLLGNLGNFSAGQFMD